MPHAVSWTLWLECNSKLFDAIKSRSFKLIHQVKGFVWSWFIGESSFKVTRLEDLIFSGEQVFRS